MSVVSDRIDVSLSVSLSQFSNMCPVGAELSLTASLPQADIQDGEPSAKRPRI